MKQLEKIKSKCRDSLNLPKDLALNKDMPAESKNYTRFHNDFLLYETYWNVF